MWLLWFFGAVALFYFCLLILSHARYHRSVMATLAEWYLRLTEPHYTESQVHENVDKARRSGPVPLCFPKRALRGLPMEEWCYGGMQVFCLDSHRNCESAVVYLHGGAYFRPPRRWHYRMVAKLCRDTHLPFYMPIYPKLPHSNGEQALRLVEKFYRELTRRYGRVVLMGDSSGGGLALLLAQAAVADRLPLPERLILLSPWVDLSLSHPAIESYAPRDPIVFCDNDRILAQIWADGLPLDHPCVSPLYGELSGLPQVDLFCGTREVLYPDICLLRDRLYDAGVSVSLELGEGLHHVYPIFPIPEARRARKRLAALVRRSLA